MNKKTLSKISAILCLSTMLTSCLTQVSYASSPDNLHHHYIGKIDVPPKAMRFEELITIKYDNGMNILMNILATYQQRQKLTGSHFVIEIMLKNAKKLNMLSSILTEKDNDGNTALKYALYNQKSFEIILKYAETAGVLKELLTSTDNEGKTILMHAASYKDDNPIIDSILSYAEKADILDTVLNATIPQKEKQQSDKTFKPYLEYSALTYAVEKNHLKNAKKLIEKGCKGINIIVFTTDCAGTLVTKPIIVSLVKNKNFEMVKLLAENDKLDLEYPIYGMNKNDLLKLVKDNKEKEVFELLEKWSNPVSMYHMLIDPLDDFNFSNIWLKFKNLFKQTH
ncbi:MAG: hypothetical protein IJI84_00975 [Clostridia bacterium]|nr:hypothetical protein [Clostridia bacterium]